jgi:hypothetical protein
MPNEPKKGHYYLLHNKQELHKSTKKKETVTAIITFSAGHTSPMLQGISVL